MRPNGGRDWRLRTGSLCRCVGSPNIYVKIYTNGGCDWGIRTAALCRCVGCEKVNTNLHKWAEYSHIGDVTGAHSVLRSAGV